MDEPNEVTLYACEPGDALLLSSVPQWFETAREEGRIEVVLGDSVDGSDWLYLQVTNGETKTLCKTDQKIVIHSDGSLHVH